MKKPFTVGNVREVMDAHERGEISYSKMVELMNKQCQYFYETHIQNNYAVYVKKEVIKKLNLKEPYQFNTKTAYDAYIIRYKEIDIVISDWDGQRKISLTNTVSAYIQTKYVKTYLTWYFLMSSDDPLEYIYKMHHKIKRCNK